MRGNGYPAERLTAGDTTKANSPRSSRITTAFIVSILPALVCLTSTCLNTSPALSQWSGGAGMNLGSLGGTRLGNHWGPSTRASAPNDPEWAVADFGQALKLDPWLFEARQGRERVQVLGRGV